MDEEDGDDHKGKNDKDTSEEEVDMAFDLKSNDNEANYCADSDRNGDEEEDEETSDKEAKNKQPEMNEDEGEGHSGKNDEDTSEEEEGNPYDVDDYERNKKPSGASNPIHDSIHKDFVDLLSEVKQMRDFKRSKHHWTSGRQKPSSKQIDEVRKLF